MPFTPYGGDHIAIHHSDHVLRIVAAIAALNNISILTSMQLRHPRPTTASRSPRLRALDGLRVVVAALTHSARAVEQHTGVTNAQLFLLQQIAGTAGLSVNDLAARARTQQSTVSIVIGRLVCAGYVRKGRDATDGRRVVLSLTASGRRLLRGAPTAPIAVLISALGKLNPRDVVALADGMHALVRALGLAPEEGILLFEDTPPRSVRLAKRARKRV